MSGEQVVPAPLLVVLRLGADVENISSQRDVCGRRLISPVEFLRAQEYATWPEKKERERSTAAMTQVKKTY